MIDDKIRELTRQCGLPTDQLYRIISDLRHHQAHTLEPREFMRLFNFLERQEAEEYLMGVTDGNIILSRALTNQNVINPFDIIGINCLSPHFSVIGETLNGKSFIGIYGVERTWDGCDFYWIELKCLDL